MENKYSARKDMLKVNHKKATSKSKVSSVLPNIISVSFLIDFDHKFLQLESSIDILQQTSLIIFNFNNFRLIFTINGQPIIFKKNATL